MWCIDVHNRMMKHFLQQIRQIYSESLGVTR
jgi:hypothetical protein